ncbi:glucitol operon DNA-binding transcriptional repressor SrlR [Basfia succiniciproducens]|uniref:Transcriptional regulator, DeoR family n=1 Tax=Basfia succiniciproducens TaxID=653940 RepID=A0A1G5DKV0_9PAST|nr:DNA-binding transcriptional repressor [Basfia succiniciproducens]QIM69475.1 transcriptional regulator [Basfia succiniciproducens]SCY15266.1 transcriptional regulator, DeoR family [Basfia succiniciproducens]SEQ29668.1 transcriptional regulator, DeoR family [Basfia succiniciproducens]
MKPRERQSAIVEFLQINGKTAVEQLAQIFKTTGTTIRKDLTALEAEKKVLRAYGSVVLVNKDEIDLPEANKTNTNLEVKRRIGQKATEFIGDGDSLLMDSGTTVLQMVPYLAKYRDLTIMTNSLHIMNALTGLERDYELLITGGTYRQKSASFHGILAESTVEKFTFDKLFIGTNSFDLDYGLTTFNEVHGVSKSMCKAAREIIVLADSSKFQRRSPNVVCPLEKINTIVTDKKLDPAIHQALIEKNINVILV